MADWLFGAPQFWLGVVACASFILVVSAFALRAPRRVIEVYRVHDRAPLPLRDPFYRSRPTVLHRGILGGGTPDAVGAPFQTARRTVFGRDMTGEARAAEARISEACIREARKRAMWHPHPDDELPIWKLAW